MCGLSGASLRAVFAAALELASSSAPLRGPLSARSSQQRWSLRPAVRLASHNKQCLRMGCEKLQKQGLHSFLVSYMPLGRRFHRAAYPQLGNVLAL